MPARCLPKLVTSSICFKNKQQKITKKFGVQTFFVGAAKTKTVCKIRSRKWFSISCLALDIRWPKPKVDFIAWKNLSRDTNVNILDTFANFRKYILIILIFDSCYFFTKIFSKFEKQYALSFSFPTVQIPKNIHSSCFASKIYACDWYNLGDGLIQDLQT